MKIGEIEPGADYAFRAHRTPSGRATRVRAVRLTTPEYGPRQVQVDVIQNHRVDFPTIFPRTLPAIYLYPWAQFVADAEAAAYVEAQDRGGLLVQQAGVALCESALGIRMALMPGTNAVLIDLETLLEALRGLGLAHEPESADGQCRACMVRQERAQRAVDG